MVTIFQQCLTVLKRSSGSLRIPRKSLQRKQEEKCQRKFDVCWVTVICACTRILTWLCTNRHELALMTSRHVRDLVLITWALCHHLDLAQITLISRALSCIFLDHAKLTCVSHGHLFRSRELNNDDKLYTDITVERSKQTNPAYNVVKVS